MSSLRATQGDTVRVLDGFYAGERGTVITQERELCRVRLVSGVMDWWPRDRLEVIHVHHQELGGARPARAYERPVILTEPEPSTGQGAEAPEEPKEEPRVETTHSHYEPHPLDFYLLDTMPDKGMFGGLHWRGRRVKDLRVEILEKLAKEGVQGATLETSQIQARLRSMNVEGMVESFPSIGQGRIWARTEKGRRHLGRKAEVLG